MGGSLLGSCLLAVGPVLGPSASAVRGAGAVPRGAPSRRARLFSCPGDHSSPFPYEVSVRLRPCFYKKKSDISDDEGSTDVVDRDVVSHHLHHLRG